jgi:hypothetical protein
MEKTQQLFGAELNSPVQDAAALVLLDDAPDGASPDARAAATVPGVLVEITAGWPDGTTRTLRRRVPPRVIGRGVGSAGIAVCGFPALAGAVRVGVRIPAACRVELGFGWPASLQEFTLELAAALGCLAVVDTAAFKGLPALERVVLNAPVDRVGSEAFRDCPSLATFECVGRGYSMGDYAFAGCVSLVTGEFPGLASAGGNAFMGCASLVSASLPAADTVGSGCFEGCVNMRRLRLSTSVKYIPTRLCTGCAQLEAVAVGEGGIPNDLTPAGALADIGNQAFEGCARLGCGGHPVILPPSVGKCGDSAFLGCTSLPGLRCRGPTLLKRRALANTSSLEEAVVGSVYAETFNRSGVVSIVFTGWCRVGQKACAGCRRLKRVAFVGKRPRSVDDYAFHACAALREVEFWGPESRTGANRLHGCVFGTWCFAGCAALVEVDLPTTASLGLGVFKDCCSLQRVSIRGGAAEMGSPDVFKRCSSLATVVLPPSFWGAGAGLFMDCKSLSVVEFPPGVDMFPDECFRGCSALRAVVAPGVRVIHSDTFAGCAELSILVASPQLKYYDQTRGQPPYFHPADDALAHCPRLGGRTSPHTPLAAARARRLDFWSTPRRLPGGAGWDHLGLPRFRREWVRFVLTVFQRLGLPEVVHTIVLECLRRHELGMSAEAAAARGDRARAERALEWPADDDDLAAV